MSSTQEVGEIFGQGRGPAHAMLRSPTVLIASVGLWGMNVFFYRLFGINYIKVLQRDLRIIEETEATVQPKKEMEMVEMVGYTGNAPPTSGNNLTTTHELALDDQDESGGADDGSTYSVEESPPTPPFEPSMAITWERLVSLSVILLFSLHFTYV